MGPSAPADMTEGTMLIVAGRVAAPEFRADADLPVDFWVVQPLCSDAYLFAATPDAVAEVRNLLAAIR